MRAIHAPLKLNDRGSEVNDLHNAIMSISSLLSSESMQDGMKNPKVLRRFFKESNEQVYGEATKEIVALFQRYQMMAEETGIVDERTAGAINSLLRQEGFLKETVRQSIYKVYGTIRDQWMVPLQKVMVKAFDQDIRSEEFVGEAFTDGEGKYLITYSHELFRKTDKSYADLILRVYDQNQQLLKSTDTYFNAPEEVEIDINLSDTIFRGESEFEKMVSELKPYIGGLGFDELNENADVQDISFLSRKTLIPEERIIKFVMANKFERKTQIQAPAFYGMLREGLPDNVFYTFTNNIPAPLDTEKKSEETFSFLMQEEVDRMSVAIKRAVDDDIIPFRIMAELDRIIIQLKIFTEEYKNKNKELLRRKSELAFLNESQKKTLEELVGSGRKGADGSLWEMLRQNDGFTSENVELIHAVFKLSDLTRENLPLVESIMQSENIKSSKDLHDLAAYDNSDWESFLSTKKIPSLGFDERRDTREEIKTYASILTQNFEKAFPTIAFTSRFQRDQSFKIDNKEKINKFFTINPAFDLLHTPISSFVKDKGNAIDSIPADEIIEPLKKIQRVYKIAPTYKSTQVLLQDDIQSSKQVYFKGRNNFINKYGEALGKKEAGDIYKRAELQYAGSVVLAAELKSLATAGNLGVMPMYKEDLMASTLADEFPSLQSLFGKADYCECEACRSVNGAAAYLTDSLAFLSERVSVNPGKSAKSVLFSRRPDIGHIDLNCKNTNTLVPYIDLANEIMEGHISPSLFTINNSFLPLIQKGKINGDLLNQLLSNPGNSAISNIHLLTENAEVSDLFQSTELNLNEWVIRDKYITLKLTETSTGVQVMLLHQTHLTADEISANPEYTNARAYKILADAHRPFSLPFDLFKEEGEIYLEKLGIKKNELINRFKKFNETPVAPNEYTESQYQEAYAFLGLNPAEQSIIFEEDPGNQPLYWGNVGTVKQVDLFQKATSLTYNELVRLLSLPFINPGQDSKIVSDDLSCDCNKKNISNLTDEKLDRMHRFLRLWKKTDLTFEELSACIGSSKLGNGSLNKNFAVRVHKFLLLKDKLSLTVPQLLSFYDIIDFKGEGSLYQELFLNKQVSNPLHPDFSVEKVTSATPVTIDDTHFSLMLAVFGVSTDDLSHMLAKTDGMLSLSNLSWIYRNFLLSQSLSLSLKDFLLMSELTNIDPFNHPDDTYVFLEKLNAQKTSGFSISELNYLLGHRDGGLVPTEEDALRDLGIVRKGLQQVRAQTQVQPDPKGDLLNKWLSDGLLNWHPAILTKLADILSAVEDDDYQQKITDNKAFLRKLRVQYVAPSFEASLFSLPATITEFPDNSKAQISYDNDKKILVFVGYMSLDDRNELLGLDGDADYQNAINQLYDLAQKNDNSPANIIFASDADVDTDLAALDTTRIPERYELFLNKISPAYKKILEDKFLKIQTGTLFKVDPNIAEQLFMLIPSIASHFNDDAFINTNKEINSTDYPDQYATYLLTSKIAFLIKKLKIPAGDLNFLFTNSATLNTLDFMLLPVQPQIAPFLTYGKWENLVNLYRLVQFLPAVKNMDGSVKVSVLSFLQSVIDGKPLAELEQELASLSGWNPTDLKYLFSSNPLQLTLTDDLKDIQVLLRLYIIFKTSHQLKVPVEKCISWSIGALTFQQSQEIKYALKSRYDDRAWLEVSQPLQDKLREAKRDALITYLLSNSNGHNWNSSNDLLGHFLIDVEMSSCQPSSRIVQANNSMQLFVQRCLMNLEQKVVADADADQDWLQWKWMQNYRVWEANRKVFLYPENWIEPELRTIKSSFFKDLENELQQKEVNKENVEIAFQDYLEKLDGVARLEVKGMWYQDDAATLHVFARTYDGDPPIYYYRKFIDNRRWTPWEKVDLDIKSDHLIPVVYNKRTYLFWPIFTEKTHEVESVSVPHPGATYNITKPTKYYQVQMAFSEYKQGKWSAKKISSDLIDYISIAWSGNSSKPNKPDKSDFLFIPLDLPDMSDLVRKEGQQNNFAKDFINNLNKNGSILINCYVYDQSTTNYNFHGTFELDPCRGYPVLGYTNAAVNLTLFDRSGWHNMLNTELDGGSNNALSVKSNSILQETPDVFRNLLPLQMGFFDKLVYSVYFLMNKNNVSATYRRDILVSLGTFMPYFYQDKDKTFYVSPEITDNKEFQFFYQDLQNFFIAVLENNTTKIQEILANMPKDGGLKMMHNFYSFYHPVTCFFIRQLFSKGIEGFMSRDTQLKGDVVYDQKAVFDFNSYYQPNTAVVYNGQPVTYPNGVTDNHPGHPKEDVSFNLRDGYSLYNWELFFHAPLMIAQRLSQNKQFEEATRWFNFIFNPTDTSSHPAPQKYWVTKPFFQTSNATYLKQRIEEIMLLTNNDPDAGAKKKLMDNIEDWRKNPFLPHNIAEYRTVAYQKTVVMKYLDHLLAWGDHMFRTGTMESVNRATQLYALAGDILGPKPQIVPPPYETPVHNFNQLEKKLDSFSNAMVEIENLLPLQEVKGFNGEEGEEPRLPRLETLYFCIPPNEKLLGYWDVVDDRLYKIRHCLNIEGVFAPLALFAPPIDPGMLVRAAAAGLDIGAILSDLNAPLPHYRFSIMLQKSIELCNEVKNLGSSLLAALEKKDTEALSMLRSDQEVKVLKAVKKVKEKQLADANAAVNTLAISMEQTELKIKYYENLINKGLIAQEKTALALNTASTVIDSAIAIGYALSGGLKLIPEFVVGAAGFGGSPTGQVKTGGSSFGNSAEDAVKTMSSISNALTKGAGLATTLGTYERRKQEWQQQLEISKKEAEHLKKQMIGAKIKVDLATLEIQNQDMQIENSEKVNEFLESKFTNAELYNWMVTQISTVYFQSYQKAYDLAKRAEQCFRHELGLTSSSYVKFGYWDSLKKGLLCGEKLLFDIRQMELDYHQLNKREYELTKNISIASLDPIALLKLKETGECWINLPEEMFDLDHPGHYFRRIKSLSVSIPCIAGPYTTVSCTLTLTKNSIRTNSKATGAVAYPRKKNSARLPADDNRFRDNVGSVQSLAISGAQNDNGLFEFNLRDERYLPFEGAGVISTWHLQLPDKFRQFDYATISDVILHMKYTAREGGQMLKADAEQSLQDTLKAMITSPGQSGLYRMFSARHDFPTQWYNFMHPPVAGENQVLEMDITERFPYFLKDLPIKITSVNVFIDADASLTNVNTLSVVDPDSLAVNVPLSVSDKFNDLLFGSQNIANKEKGKWTIVNNATGLLTPEQVKDLIVVFHYEV